MVDNVQITAGSGTTVAADDIAGVLHQRVKISVGADGAASDMVGGAGAVSAAVPRVTLASDDPAVALLGTIDADTSVLSGAVTSSRLATNPISGQSGITGGAGAVGAACPRVTIATDDQTAANINNALKGEYETVAASQTAQVLGATGGTGDYLAGVLIVPATTSPGSVAILDNATSITIFTGGASSVSNLVPFMVPLGMTSVSGAWKITTGANVSCIGIGNFT